MQIVSLVFIQTTDQVRGSNEQNGFWHGKRCRIQMVFEVGEVSTNTNC